MPYSVDNVSSAFKVNNRWICDNIETLRQQYNNQWVAVHNQAVIDSGPDLRKLVDRLKVKHPINYAEIAVEYITTDEPEEIEPSDDLGP